MEATAVLTCLRRYHRFGVGVFVALVLLVGLERRLGEMHHDLRSADPGVESVDSLDGDEIRGRLVILNDDRPPTLSTAAPGAIGIVVPGSVEPPYFALVGRPEPRAPPIHHSSAA
jgi:hypothetical protein